MFNQAEAAKLIRNNLKTRGIKAKVSSSCKGGISRVNITLYDLDPSTYNDIAAYVNDFRYKPLVGHTPANHKPDDSHPKVKCVFLDRVFSDDVRQKALDYVTNKLRLPKMNHATIDPKQPITIDGDKDNYIGDILHYVLKGVNCYTFHYWRDAA